MDIEYFRQFMEMAKGESISQAARDLFTSQSALSRHIRALEEDFGVKLINRSYDGIEITPEGEVVLDLAERLVNRYDMVKAAFATPQKAGAEIVVAGHIDAPEDISCFVRASELLQRDMPCAKVSLLPCDAVSLGTYKEKLVKGEVDVLFLFGDMQESFKTDEGFICREAVSRKWYVIAGPQSPLYDRDYLTVDDLQHQYVMHFVGERYSSSWKTLRRLFTAYSIKYKERLVRCQSLYDYLGVDIQDALLFFPPPNNAFVVRNEDRKVLELRGMDDFTLEMYAVYREGPKADLIGSFVDLAAVELAPKA